MSRSTGSSWHIVSRPPGVPSSSVWANGPPDPWPWAPRSGDWEAPDDLADSLDWTDDEYDSELAELELLWEEYGMICHWGFRSFTETVEEETRRKAREEEIRRMIEEAERRGQTKPNQKARKEAIRKAKEEEMGRRRANAQAEDEIYTSPASSQLRRSVTGLDDVQVLRGPNTRASDLSRLGMAFNYSGRQFSPSSAFGNTASKRGAGGSRRNNANRFAALGVEECQDQDKKWAPAPASAPLSEISAWYKVKEDVKEYLNWKNVDKAIVALQSLPAKHRHLLVSRLANDALDSGDHVVKLAEKLFEAARERGVVSPENFERGLLSIVGFANHINNDIPKTYEWLARFLFAAGFNRSKVEELANKIEVEGVPRIHPKDQLLKEFEKVWSPSVAMNALPREADDHRPTEEEEERKAKEKEELRLRKEFERHERVKAKAQAKKESKRREKEEREAQLKAEAEARIKKAAELEAKQEAERQAGEEEERKAKEGEELRLKEKAERKARAREEAIARRQARAEEKARAEAERKAREEEARRVREAEERQLKEENERKAQLKAETEAKARAEEEARARQEAEHRAKEEAERKAKEEEQVRLRAEAEAKAREVAALKAKLEAEREAREKEKRRIRDEKERKAKEEERRLKDEAERKAREERKAKEEEERRLKEAERKAREAEEARLKAEAEAKAKAREEARLKEEAERKAKEEARLKAEAEAKATEEAEARAKADAEAAAAAAKANEEAEAPRTPSPSGSPRHTNNLLRSIVPSYPSPPSFTGDPNPDSNASDVPGQLGTLPPPLLDDIGPEPRERDTSYPTSTHDEDRQSVGPSGLGSTSIGGQATPTTQSVWPGGAEDNVLPVSIPLEPVAPLKVSENRWVGGNMQGTQQKIQDLLNKLTVDNFDWTSHWIIRYANRSEQVNDGSMLMHVVKLVFASARDSPMYAGMYAQLCHRMTELLSPNIQDDTTQDWDEQATTGGMLFRKYLFNLCQAEFQRGWDAEGTELAVASRARRRGLGLVRFMGELFRLQMLTERTVHGCIKKLLSNATDPKEEDIESLCELLKIVGGALDSPKARSQMDTYFERMKGVVNRSNLNWRIRFMLLDVLELRAGQWQARPPRN